MIGINSVLMFVVAFLAAMQFWNWSSSGYKSMPGACFVWTVFMFFVVLANYIVSHFKLVLQ